MADPSTSAEALAERLLAMSETHRPVVDAVAGYRAQLVERGFSARAAEAMAVQYHAHVLGILVRQERSREARAVWRDLSDAELRRRLAQRAWRIEGLTTARIELLIANREDPRSIAEIGKILG